MKKISVTEKLNEVLEIAQSLIQEEEKTETKEEIVEVIPNSEISVEVQQTSNSSSMMVQHPTNSVTPVDIFQEIEDGTKDRLNELNSDIKNARENLSFLVNLGKDAADELQNLAIESEEPRMYEVLSELISSISSVTKEMISLHKVRSDIIRNEFERKRPVKDEIKNLTQNNTNTTVYLNTTDVIKAIREGAIDADVQPTTD